MRDAFFDKVLFLMQRDPNVRFLTADMGAFGISSIEKAFPDQFINVGVSEQLIINLAAGLALRGKRVFICGITPFVTQRCYEQISASICNMNLPVTIIGLGPGFTYGPDGPTHHALNDIAIMRSLPGMTIFSPSCREISEEVMSRIVNCGGPSYVRLEKGELPDVPGFVCNSEDDLTIVSHGAMIHYALEIRDILFDRGFDIGVVDLFQIWPVPEDIVQESSSWYKVITLEEHSIIGGIGDIIGDLVGSRLLKKFAVTDFLPRYESRDQLYCKNG